MASERHLSNAPISEAIIDIRVALPKSVEPAVFSPLKSHLMERFNTCEELHSFQADVGVKNGQPLHSTTDLGVRGLLFRSVDKTIVVQFRVDGFTYSRLRPYTSWEQILPDAIGLFRLYEQTAGPDLIFRLAVRYINQIEFSLPVSNVGTAIVAVPQVPVPSQAINRFVSILELTDLESGVTTNFVQALQPSTNPTTAVVVVDIDSFMVRMTGFRSGEITETLSVLRRVKNKIFFSALTDEMIRSYE